MPTPLLGDELRAAALSSTFSVETDARTLEALHKITNQCRAAARQGDRTLRLSWSSVGIGHQHSDLNERARNRRISSYILSKLRGEHLKVVDYYEESDDLFIDWT